MTVKQLRKILTKNRLCLLFLTILFLSVSMTSAQEKVVVIPLFDDQKPAGPPSPVPKTGQTTSYATGDDGDLEKGLPWPTPRFTDNDDGTVTDNLTGLIWLKNANCFDTKSWATALSDCNGLADGICGLTDGSVAGDWRLSDIKELQSLCDYGRIGPAFPSEHPFKNMGSASYWSSTTRADETETAYAFNMYNGAINTDNKIQLRRVWPVRGGN